MIIVFPKGNKRKHARLLELINDCHDIDFYLTENNTRYYDFDNKLLKKLLDQTSLAYVYEEEHEYKGFVIIWKSSGGSVTRYYVKLIANSPSVAQKLLMIINWNWKKELYVKIDKDSEFLKEFRSKGYKFIGGRGRQVLLKRNKYSVRSNKGERLNGRSTVRS